MSKTTKPIRFTKMHGLGNDFVVISTHEVTVDIDNLPIKKLADRHVGIGFDQMLLFGPSSRADFFCRIYNADGSEAEQCGNGLRCLARYIHEEGLTKQAKLTFETKAGIFPVFIENYERIRVTMNAPDIKEKCIEFASEAPAALPLSILSIGNPHAIVKVDSIDNISADKLSVEIAALPFFSDGANVGFMQVIDDQHIRLRTYERGVGETFACGSNACAAAAAGMINGWLCRQVNVAFRYGSLFIEWEGEQKPIHMTGPAARVFAGEIIIPAKAGISHD